MSEQPTFRAVEFDGLVVEDARGSRLLALPAAVIPELRQAAVIRYRLGDSHFSMRLTAFADGRTAGKSTTQARDELAPAEPPQRSAGSAPTPQYGAPALPVHGAQNPSPTPPPAPEQDQEDPANIPLRARRNGEWITVHVTRAQYEEYQRQGRIAPTAPAETAQQATDEGNEQ